VNDADRDRYLRFVRAVGTGEAITEDDWLFHFDHQNAGARSGVDEAQRAPDFTLPDQHGVLRSRPALSGANGLLLVFARSADW
jgi:hypothetical protein